MKNVKIDENYYLITQEVNKDSVKIDVAKEVNHIVIIDVSGSMSYELPEIRKNLKNKLSTMVKENDTVTLIYFSGRGEAGILKEAVKVSSLKQLTELHEAIDRFLKPIGMTGFAKPIELASEVIKRISLNNSTSVFSMCFMSDGGNNSDSWESVVKALNNIAPDLSFSTIIEYGNWADSKRLTEMSSILGGSKITSESFEEYNIILAENFKRNIFSDKKIIVDINSSQYDFVFSVSLDGSILVYNIVNNKVMIGSDVSEIYFFNKSAIGSELVVDDNVKTALYSAVYVLSDKLLNEDAEKLFYIIKDNYYYRMLANSFGKQKLNAFKASIRDCVSDLSKRYPEGVSDIKKVDDNTFCLMNLIDGLSKTNTLFYPNHEDFNYNRIGRKKVAIGDKLVDADKEKLAAAKDVTEMLAIAKELEENKLKTEFVDSDPNRGYSLGDLVWNEERANLSVRVKYSGKVVLPKNKFKIDDVASYIYRTYSLIKDGILNVTKLPVNYDESLITWFKYNNVAYEVKGDFIIIDLSSIPVINRSMVKSISAVELAKLEWELLKCQAEAKVYGDYRKTLFPKTSKSFADMLGQECADWLKEIGITEFNGYAPKTQNAESTDFYMSVNLITKIKGLSALPKVSDVVAKMANANAVLKTSEWLMSFSIKKVQSKLNEKDFDLEKFIINQADFSISRKRDVMQKIAEIKFALILSKGWFVEFKSFDENTLNVKLDNIDLNYTFDLTEKQEKI